MNLNSPDGSQSKMPSQGLKSPLRCNITSEQTPPSLRKIAFGDRFIPSAVRRTLDFSKCIPEVVEKKEKVEIYECCQQTEAEPSPDCESSKLKLDWTVHEKQSENQYEILLKNEFKDTRIESVPIDDETNYRPDSSERLYFHTYHESSQSSPTVFNSSARNPFCQANQKILQNNLSEYRKISYHPFKVLDAPGLPNDYYLNLIDWSKNDVLAVALGDKIYLWEFGSSKIIKTIESHEIDATISCVKWCVDLPHHLTFTTSNGFVYIHDVDSNKTLVKRQLGQNQRIGSADWTGRTLSVGSRDGIIRHFDARSLTTSVTSSLHGHSLEVCGLKWDSSGKTLASGGNDNKVLLWCLESNLPIATLNGHQGAVKALAWSPHEYGVLTSGGGSADRCIKFWNTKSLHLIKSVDTQSQVCNLAWSSTEKELLSTHGFSSNAINLWKYPTMDKLISLRGHTSRVIYMSTSPDGQKVVTGSSDETLRFWDIFTKSNIISHKPDFDIFTCGSIR